MRRDRCEFVINPFVKKGFVPDGSSITSAEVFEFHKTIPGYAPTPLVELKALASELGLGKIFVKDESKRLGLNAFKVLGVSFAIHQWQKKHPNEKNVVFSTATDGNHGRAVARTARKIGAKAVIYVPQNTSEARIAALKHEGAEVVVVPSHYDDAVKQAAADAKTFNRQIISDIAYPGNMEIPGYIMSGYTTIFREEEQTLHGVRSPEVDVVLLQAGMGGFAAAGTWYYVNRYAGLRPKLVCVEPTDADCFVESIKNGLGEPLQTKGSQNSIMAGLNCGTPSLLAWPIMRDGMDLFMSITDDYAKEAMVCLGKPRGNDPRIVSGESGAAGLGGLLALMKRPDMREAKRKLELGPNTRVLLISTEGDTDPVNYKKILGE